MYKSSTNSLFISKNLIYLPVCQSTNDEAAQLLTKKPIDGTIVITDHQTAGRGQRGNSWQTSAGQNLTFTLILKPNFLAINEQFDLNIAITLGIYDALKNIVGEGLTLKWPNDIYVGDQKLGGVLIENSLKNNRIEYAIIGIGLNINEQLQRHNATSLSMITGSSFDLQTIFDLLCGHIEAHYLQLKTQKIGGTVSLQKPKYLSCLYRYQEKHWFEADGDLFEGIIVGVQPQGFLAVQIDNELRYYDFKQIKFIIK